ncbi:MAG: ATP-binding cassette domain-containing protein [Gammaproteobacteria bacterium]|nr:ATP-binding cassette domain-containing protein [Gammaproteobacteria bacterium]
MLGRVLKDAHHILGWRLATLITLMVAASTLEGLGLSLLLPLLSSFGLDGEASSPLTRTINAVVDGMGISREIGPLMALVVTVLVLQVSVTFLRSWFETYCTTLVSATWRKRLFHTVINAQWTYLQQSDASAQANAIVNDVNRICAALSVALQCLNASLFIGVYAIISLAAAWEMVVFLLLFSTIVYTATRPISRHSNRVGKHVTHVSSRLLHHTIDFLSNSKLVKSTATEAAASSLFDDSVDAYRETDAMARILPSVITFIYMSTGYIALGFGVWLALEFTSTAPGAVMVSIYVFMRLYVQITTLQHLKQAFAVSAPALTATQKLLSEADAAVEAYDTGTPPSPLGAVGIEVRDLSIDYAGRSAVRGVSATIAPGSIVGITGASGAGKSTFIDAVVGLIKPNSGSVNIDGIPVTALEHRAWRRQIGFVAQDTLLIAGTVAQNIAWGSLPAQADDIECAARLTGAHDFITDLPDGYETVIGGRNIKMSGGQRQRLGLTRAILGNKRLLVLDEATSALDSASEQQVLAAIEALRGQVTIVMVAHRLSTLRSADHVLVFDKGLIVESGTFDALKSSGGRFDTLWSMQTGEVAVNSRKVGS